MGRRLYIAGGKQKPQARALPEWQQWAEAVLVELDLETGATHKRISYVTPPEARSPDNSSVLFKAGTLSGDRYFACTPTEVLVFNVPEFEQIGYVSLPCFNDLHHVRPTPSGTLLVANTGLDAVVEVTLSGEVVQEWSVLGNDTWSRFSREIDYRRVATTKPHESHPNYVFELGGHFWVTRYQQKDAICLTGPGKPLSLSSYFVHDGILWNGSVYFTSVAGQVVEVDTNKRQIRRTVDLTRFFSHDIPLGWCRGLEVLDDEHIAVGFSRLRPTRWRENILWLKHRFGGEGWGIMPTRVVTFDLRREKVCEEWPLEAADLNVIFSIHAVPDVEGRD